MIDDFARELDGVTAYIDDVLVWADTEIQLTSRVEEMLRKAKEWGLRFNASKVQWGQTVEYLGTIGDQYTRSNYA